MLAVDHSFQPYIKTAYESFEPITNRGKLVLNVVSETEARNLMAQGKTNSLVGSMTYSKKDSLEYVKANRPLRSYLIAHDAIVFVINKKNPDSLLTENQILDILSGKLTAWPINKQKIEVAFDDVQSANFNYFKTNHPTLKFADNINAAGNSKKALEYLTKNEAAMAILGYNLFSDLDDPKVLELLKKYTIISVSPKSTKVYWKPNKPNIQAEKYPFRRPIYYHVVGTPISVDQHFADFLLSRAGQLLVEKCELIQGKITSREINITIQ
jgi:phosphate transport system substrate-binding protein